MVKPSIDAYQTKLGISVENSPDDHPARVNTTKRDRSLGEVVSHIEFGQLGHKLTQLDRSNYTTTHKQEGQTQRTEAAYHRPSLP
jgi:hypothetical protein